MISLARANRYCVCSVGEQATPHLYPPCSRLCHKTTSRSGCLTRPSEFANIRPISMTFGSPCAQVGESDKSAAVRTTVLLCCLGAA